MRRGTLILAAVLAVAGCSGETPGERTVLGSRPDSIAGIPEEVRVHLDSGTAAFRAKDYEEARAQYGKAAQAGPGLAATWLGVAMAERALGNSGAADSAMDRARAIAPDIGGHPTEAGAMQGHPPVGPPPAGGASPH